jgi:hypothetical protein
MIGITVMMGATSISETSANFYKATQLQDPEDSHLHTGVSFQSHRERAPLSTERAVSTPPEQQFLTVLMIKLVIKSR